MINGPFKTGDEPTAITIDPRGLYIYIANSLDNSVSAYAIALPTGTPSTVVNATSTSGNGTDTQPASIVVDPALGRYVYTANYLGNSVSGLQTESQYGLARDKSGHALPDLRNSDCGGCHPARQPRTANRYAVIGSTICAKKPSRTGWAFCGVAPSDSLLIAGHCLSAPLLPCVFRPHSVFLLTTPYSLFSFPRSLRPCFDVHWSHASTAAACAVPVSQ